MISQPVMMALLSPLAGKLSDKYNPGIIASAGMGLTAAGLIMLCFVTAASPIYPDYHHADNHGHWFWAVLLAQFKCNHEFC